MPKNGLVELRDGMFLTAGKRWGWDGPGAGIFVNQLTPKNGYLAIKDLKEKKTYTITRAKARKLWKKYNSTYMAGTYELAVIPTFELTPVKPDTRSQEEKDRDNFYNQ